MQNLIQVRKVSFKKCHPSKLHDHFILFLLFWKKRKEKENKYKIGNTIYKQHNDTINGSPKKKIITTWRPYKKKKLKFKENKKITWKLEGEKNP